MKIANSNPVRLTHSACLHQHRHPVNTAAPVDSFVPTASGPSIPEQGEAGLGDSLFPNLGNGGYDAQHYRVEVDVDERGNLQGKTTMTARAERDLASFHLDFRGFDISKITVNGQSAPYERQDAELIIHPQQLLSGGQDFDVSVEYAGTPHGYRSPFAPVRLGWNNFRDGSYVVSQPDGASSWYPVNDHPSDKATYDFEITVPRPLVAVANGTLESAVDKGDKTTYSWKARDPMASYLATVHVGDYVRREQTGPNGLPIRHYFPADIADEAAYDFGRVPEMLEYFGNLFGPYPFEVYGGIVMDTQIGGAALETQTLPLYERGMVTGNRAYETVYVHELAHHWFGDSISLKDWRDIWLNEGFATYAQWLWDERNHGREAIEREAESVHRRLRGGGDPVAKPGADGLFSHRVYMQGGLTLHAYRREVGDEKFFKTIRTYFDRFKGKTADTEDFIKVASEVAERPMDEFFGKWLYGSRLPDLPPSTA